MVVRIAIVFGVLGALGLAAQWFPRASALVLLLCFGAAALASAQDWLQKVRWPRARTQMRWIRHMRRAIHPPPLAMAAYSSVIAVAIFSLVMLAGFSQPLIMTLGGAIATVLLAVAGIVDVAFRLRVAWKFNLVRTAIKWLGLFVATATIFGATVVEKNLAHAITHINPEQLQDFVRLTTALV